MQDNPFYPGYNPADARGDEPGSPFYPGYYPGQPIQRQPISRDYLESLAYDPEMFFRYIDMADMAAQELMTPKWFKDRILDDIKSSMRASIRPQGISAERLDDYETDELPGAFGIGVPLYPTEWQEPGEQAKKLLKSWGKAAVSLEDFDTRTRVAFWDKMMETEKMSDLAEGPKAVFTRAAPLKMGSPPMKNPLYLKETGVTLETKSEVEHKKGIKGVYKREDLGNKMSQKIIDFERARDSPRNRDTKHDDFLKSALNFVNTDFQNRKEDILGIGTGIGAGGMYNSAIEINDTFHKVQFGEAAHKGLSGLNTSVSDATKSLNKSMMGVSNISAKVKKDLDNLEKNIKSFRTNLERRATQLEALPVNAESNVSEMMRLIRKQHDYVDNLEAVLDQRERITERRLHQKLKNVNAGKGPLGNGSPLSGGDLISDSLERQWLRLWEDMSSYSGKKTKSKLVPWLSTYSGKRDPTNIGTLLEEESLGLESSKARFYISRLRADRIDASVDQFMDAFVGGKLLENFVWRRVSNRLQGYTPAWWVTKALSKAHFFGLKIDRDHLTDSQKKAFDRFRTYKFNLEFNVKGSKVTRALRAGRHLGLEGGGLVNDSGRGLKTLNQLGTLFSHNRAGALNNDALTFLLTSKHLKLLRVESLIKLAKAGDVTAKNTLQTRLEGFIMALKAKNGGDLPFETDPKRMLEFLQNFEKMKEHVQKQLPDIDFGDPDIAKEFYDKLTKFSQSADNLNLNNTYIGWLQKLFMVLNRLQTRIINSRIIGPIIKLVFGWKNIAVERATSFLTKGLPKLIEKVAPKLAAALVGLFAGGGVLTPLAQKVLLPIFRWAMRTGLAFGAKVVEGILKGDWELAIRELEKTVNKMINTVLKIMLVPVFALFALIFGMFGTTNTTVSPVDPYDSNQGYGGGYMAFPAGENLIVRVTKDAIVTLIDGTTVTNPTDPIPNGMAVSVRFRVTITPLVTITDGSVEWEDIAMWRNNTTVETILEHPGGGGREVLDPFESGIPIVFEFYPDGETQIDISSVEDAMVSNTATVYTPAVEAVGAEHPDVVNFTRSFIIGDYVPDCPLVTPTVHILTSSYRDDVVGHGDTGYWYNQCTTGWDPPLPPECIYVYGNPLPDISCRCICNWSIPWMQFTNACHPNGGENCAPMGPASNICLQKYGAGSASPYYGYALDPSNPPPGYASAPVVLPPIGIANRTWTIDDCNTSRESQHNVWASSSDGGHEIRLYMTHLDLSGGCPPLGTAQAGFQVAPGIYTGWNAAHVHIEMMLDGIPVKPECFMCMAVPPSDCPAL